MTTHLLRLSDKAGKKLVARCSYEVKFPKDGRLPAEFTVWASDVDCKACQEKLTII